MKKLLFFFCMALFVFSFAQAQQIPILDSSLQQYTGRYVFPDGSVITEALVTLENGALTVTSSAGISSLEKKSEDLYIVTKFSGTAKFNRDASKKITGISILARGHQLEGTKTEVITVLPVH